MLFSFSLKVIAPLVLLDKKSRICSRDSDWLIDWLIDLLKHCQNAILSQLSCKIKGKTESEFRFVLCWGVCAECCTYFFKSVAKFCSLQKHEMEDSEIVPWDWNKMEYGLPKTCLFWSKRKLGVGFIQYPV